MFGQISQSFGKIFDQLRGRATINEDDIDRTMREIRVALLEADVALPVVRQLIERIKTEALGAHVVQSLSPGQVIIKIVHDQLASMLHSDEEALKFDTAGPSVFLLAGLQGAGKTTTAAKLAFYLKSKLKKKVFMASLDVYRPAAREQLAVLGRELDITTLPIDLNETNVTTLAKQALHEGKKGGFDIILLDTAGRLHTNEALMDELIAVKKIASPIETLLVADALTGQDSVNIAKSFHDTVGLTGIILTRMDADGRGGAALSMRQVTGCPIKWMGCGEKPSELEPFHSERIASRILGMGDVVSLVERAQEAFADQDAEKMAKKLQKGIFDLNDLASQIKTIRKMGGMSSMLGMLPGMGKIKDALNEKGMDESILNRQLAMISSMTPRERRNPDLLNASRKRRIAAGSGVQVHELNRLLKQHMEMARMLKKLKGMDPSKLKRGGMGKLFS
jgi:signal recognition particle subunit SRP54